MFDGFQHPQNIDPIAFIAEVPCVVRICIFRIPFYDHFIFCWQTSVLAFLQIFLVNGRFVKCKPRAYNSHGEYIKRI